MRSDHEPVAARPQRREIAECSNVVGSGREIDEQDVASFNRALHTRNEDDALVAGILDESSICQNPIVKGDGQRVEPELSRAINQLVGVVCDDVGRILRCMQMQVYFQHVQFLSVVPVTTEQASFRHPTLDFIPIRVWDRSQY